MKKVIGAVLFVAVQTGFAASVPVEELTLVGEKVATVKASEVERWNDGYSLEKNPNRSLEEARAWSLGIECFIGNRAHLSAETLPSPRVSLN